MRLRTPGRGPRGGARGTEGLSHLQDRFADGSSGPLKDICPFTAMGIFNRGITDANRQAIARGLAHLLGVSEPVPDSFEGIPILNNQTSWFFGYDTERRPDDMDALWEVFDQAMAFAASDAPEARSAFVSAYDDAARRPWVKWNLTMGLYWIRPWNFPPLDGRSRNYIQKELAIPIGMGGPKNACTATEYLAVRDALNVRFQDGACPVCSFPELSLAAWAFSRRNPADDSAKTWKETLLSMIEDLCHETRSLEFTRQQILDRFETDLEERFPNNHTLGQSVSSSLQTLRDEGRIAFVSPGRYRFLASRAPSPAEFAPPSGRYSLDDILTDGCFIAREKLETMFERLRTKKNLILQGPPGTGKTWLAKRLAFALAGQRESRHVRAVQFHPNLSHEDFVRGWRPAGNGTLTLSDGPFVEMIDTAHKNPDLPYVLVIEEINRGNPAQIFGEMLTLLEADKRTSQDALELSYKRFDGERVFIPDNLYVIGTMNIADRSLALVDLALRRRFAFINLEPTFGEPWRNWCRSRCGLEEALLAEIEKRLMALNDDLSDAPSLGPQFCVGHSYVTPPSGASIPDGRAWFRRVVGTEIGPLLDEYWFDAPKQSQEATKRLLEGL